MKNIKIDGDALIWVLFCIIAFTFYLANEHLEHQHKMEELRIKYNYNQPQNK